MQRREFIVGLGAAASWPLAARAQQPAAKYPTIGFIGPSTASADVTRREVFRGCLDSGSKLVFQMTLMTVGLYQEPIGAWMPSVLYGALCQPARIVN